MEFGLSEDQKILEDSVRRFLEDASPLDRVREIADRGDGFDEAIWNGLVGQGLTGVLVPEEHGGAGMAFLDAVIILEALGRTVTPAPFLGGPVMAAVALGEGGSDAQKAEWLPKIADGTAKFGIGVAETMGARENAGVTAKDGKISGTALFVIDASSADVFLVAAGVDTLALVPREAATVEPLVTIDRTRSLGEVSFDNAAADFIGGEGGGAQAIARMTDAGRIALAADTLGAAEVMIEKAVAYSKEREQFGRVIGSFQAVKHMCAEMIADLEPCRSLVWYAAHAFHELPKESRLNACHAKAHLAEVGRFVARTATEAHGGMGFTDLLGLHYWFKRIGADRQLLGGPERVRHEAAVAQGWIAA